jgi:hypothetical protein
MNREKGGREAGRNEMMMTMKGCLSFLTEKSHNSDILALKEYHSLFNNVSIKQTFFPQGVLPLLFLTLR